MHFKLVNQEQQGRSKVGDGSILILCLVPFPQSLPANYWPTVRPSPPLLPVEKITSSPVR